MREPLIIEIHPIEESILNILFKTKLLSSLEKLQDSSFFIIINEDSISIQEQTEDYYFYISITPEFFKEKFEKLLYWCGDKIDLKINLFRTIMGYKKKYTGAAWKHHIAKDFISGNASVHPNGAGAGGTIFLDFNKMMKYLKKGGCWYIAELNLVEEELIFEFGNDWMATVQRDILSEEGFIIHI